MKATILLTLAALALTAPAAHGQSGQPTPHIGYVCPAGGRQGSVVEVTVGGQFLRGVTAAYVSGEGVRASVVRHYPPVRNLSREQRQELRRRLEELRDKRLAELGIQARPYIPGPPLPRARRRGADGQSEDAEPVKLPDHPLLRDLESMNLRQLLNVAREFLDYRTTSKRQLNAQIAEMVLLEVTIDRGALPGDRELRLATPLGLTNPVVFQVGTLPEVLGQEPDEPQGFAFLPEEPPIELPAVLNGQIMPGDIDRFRIRARQGQHLVVATSARRLVPFLADAVPGWFQATLALYDEDGREVAFADDYLFDPDPVLLYEVPRDGVYELVIRDAIYRGREDFVYRIAVGELPFVTQAFPLGGRAGVSTVAAVDGWNLATTQLKLDTRADEDGIRQTVLHQDGTVSNDVTYAVGTLPECTETEPNDDPRHAQPITLPVNANGRIDAPADVDVYRFEGHAGEEVVAEVLARRLHSPMDSLLRVTDASGRVLAWNDDNMRRDGTLHPDMGRLTHHADSYLSVRLPEDGTYYVRVSDAQNHGGDAYGYRLRVCAPQPDFKLLMTPSSLSIPAGFAVPFTVHALRQDGFAGEIEVVLKDAPAGFRLSGGRIPAGKDHVRMTLRAPSAPQDGPVTVRLEGRARIDGRTVRRPVVPAEEVMQAFLWRHLVPSQELVVTVRTARGRRFPIRLGESGTVRIPAGGTAQVRIDAQLPAWFRERLSLELNGAPEGISLEDVALSAGSLSFRLRADADAIEAGSTENLIVEAFVEPASGAGAQNAGQQANRRRRFPLGALPAIPIEVVAP